MNDLTAIPRAIKCIVRKHGEGIQCLKFHHQLKSKFPEAVPYYTGNHVVSLIAGRFWDKNGCYMYPLEMEPAMKSRLIEAMEVANE